MLEKASLGVLSAVRRGRASSSDSAVTTTARMRVSSFAKAYNILPDLLTARLEVGVEIVQDWIQADPVAVELK